MTESALADLVRTAWSAELGGDGEPDRPFVAAGGHSLAAARLAARLRDDIGVEVAMSYLLRHDPTLTDLIDLAERAGVVEPPAVLAVPSARSAPIGPNLRRVWAWHRLYPESPAYNVVRVLRVDGRVDPTALRAALGDLAVRHEALRCAVVEERGQEPEIVVGEAGAVPLTVELCPDTVDDAIAALADRPFDLATAPLWRVGLFYSPRLRRSWIAVVLHHLVADLRASDVVLADLATAYAARRDGGVAAFAPAPSLLANLAGEAGWEGTPAWVDQLAWWRERLRGVGPAGRLPLAASHADDADFAADVVTLDLSATESSIVDDYLRCAGLTPAVHFLAATSVVLTAWWGGSRALLGVPGVRVGRAADAGLVGFTLDTLILPVEVEPADSFTAVTATVRESLLSALDHSLPPFDQIVDTVAVPRSGGRTPLLQLWFNDLTQANPPSAFGPAPAQELARPPRWALFDTGVYLGVGPSGYQLHLVTARGLLAAHDAVALAEQITRLAVRAAADPDARVGDLVAAAPADPTPTDPTDPTPTDPTPADPTPTDPAGRSGLDRPTTAELVTHHATVTPDAPAIVDDAGTVSYAELDRLVDQVAADLRLRPSGAVVLVPARRHRDFVVALLAGSRSMTTVAIVDAGWPAARQDRAVRMGGVTHRYDGPGRLNTVHNGPEPDPVGTAGISHLLFTSGTTGDPLAVRVAAGQVDAALDDMVVTFALTAADRVSLLSGPAHDPALRDIGFALRAAASLHIPPAAVAGDPGAVVDWLGRHEVTVVNATAPLLNLVLSLADRPLPAVRLVISGGAPLTPTVARLLRRVAPAATIVNGYGCTETPQLITAEVIARGDPVPAGDRLPIGAPLPGRRVEVRDRDGRRCEVGVLGSIWVAEPHIAAGYAGGVDNGRFLVDPAGRRWLATGDLARRDGSGRLWLAGRADRQALVNGYRFTPDELEAVAREVDGVTDAVGQVVAGADGETLRVWVAAAPAVTADMVRARLRAVLPPALATARVIVAARLPLDGNLKSRPGDEAAVDATAPAVPPVPAPAASHGLERLHTLVERFLGRPVERADNFFDVGFTSMSLLQFGVEINEEFGLSVPALELFRYPNLGALGPALFGPTDPDPVGPPPAPAGVLAGRLASMREARRRARARLGDQRGEVEE